MAPVNPYTIVSNFEEALAEYSGSNYAVCVESCTSALFLSLMYQKHKFGDLGYVEIPSRTYPGVACSIIHAGGKVLFNDVDWKGVYELRPWGIVDGALRFRKNMYNGGLHCLSFHGKKRLNIGRGGAILTNDFTAVEWFRKARFDGRNPVPLQEDNFTMLGWNCYLQPEQAARGIQLMQAMRDKDLPDLSVEEQKYADLSQFKIYTQ
jgi:dTDP-4-amino-4,6-dideoxygalactose transaminase